MVMDYSIDIFVGYICYLKIGKDILGEKMYFKLSDFFVVKFGFLFWCYEENNIVIVVEKLYVNYIVVFIIFFIYCFYLFVIEFVFYIEDKKIV